MAPVLINTQKSLLTMPSPSQPNTMFVLLTMKWDFLETILDVSVEIAMAVLLIFQALYVVKRIKQRLVYVYQGKHNQIS